MGNNAAFSAFEASVMACYDHGVLSKSLLSALMEPYRGMDIDSGGMAGTLSKEDNLDIIDVTLKTWGETVPPRPELPEDYREWTPSQHAENEAWQESRWSAFHAITSQFGWS
jgi:hypothetical protein